MTAITLSSDELTKRFVITQFGNPSCLRVPGFEAMGE
jgi:hypothetical protein